MIETILRGTPTLAKALTIVLLIIGALIGGLFCMDWLWKYNRVLGGVAMVTCVVVYSSRFRLGCLPSITIIASVLKLTGYISWPWIWVLAPLWLPIFISMIVVLSAIAVGWDT